MNTERDQESIAAESLSDAANPYATPANYPAQSGVKHGVHSERPRLWTVFAVFFVAMGAMLVFTTIVIVIYLGPTLFSGVPPQQSGIMDKLFTPYGFIVQALPAQLAIILPAILAAILSPVEWKQRLGFTDSGLTKGQFLATGIGAFFPTAIGLGLAYLVTLVIPPDDSIANLYKSMTFGWSIPFILFIALLPGFAEEIMMRGYMQRRLLKRWAPWLAILVSSILFAVMHVTPHAISFAFPIGVWLGYVAWKTDSIWPTIFCHALINGTWNIVNVYSQLLEIPEQTQYVVLGVLFVVGLVCFVFSWSVIRRIDANRHAGTVAG